MAIPVTDIFKTVSAVSGTQDFVSESFKAEFGSLWSVHFQFTGTPAGTLALFQSNIEAPGRIKTVNWVPVPTTEVDFAGKVPTGAPLESFIQISASAALNYLLVYTNTAGSGIIKGFTRVGVES